MSEETKTLAKPGPGEIARTGFGTQELARSGETASSAAAAQATAAIQARYIVAMQRPRDWDNVRTALLVECKRPGAAKAFWYRKPIGKGVEGLSVRFAEAAMRCMTNVDALSTTTWDDKEKRVVTHTVTDLESNVTITKSIVVEKSVERSTVPTGEVALRTRTNSKGEPVYTVRATEDEMLGKENALVSKALRESVKRILPGNLQDECKALILQIRRGAAVKDPDAERHKIVDAFAELRVPVADLKKWLGHDLGTASPKELEDLRDAYNCVKNGEFTWHELLTERLGEDAGERPVSTQPAGSTLDRAADALAGEPAAEPPPSEDRERSAELDRAAAAESATDDPLERGRAKARARSGGAQQKELP